jgi:hypothetical protein
MRLTFFGLLVTSNFYHQFSTAFVARQDGNARGQTELFTSAKPKKVVIIGGGWAGFSAADALITSPEAVEVELLDASPRGPGGLAGGWRTPKLNRPVEAGLHGFWREYRNTFAAIENIGLSLNDVLTDFTPSILVSKSGRVALAPVLGNREETSSGSISSDRKRINNNVDMTSLDSLLKKIADLLPPPLDVALLADFEQGNPLTLVDRASALGLLGIWADFEQEDADSWKKYDKISADHLFRYAAGVTTRLYEELVSPLLHVLPMTTGYDCSAAAALSCFHVFALQAKGAFDVRWCRGTISEKIFNPWTTKLKSSGLVKIRGASMVTSLEEMKDGRFNLTVNGDTSLECDAVILAVGGTAIKRLLPNAPPLSNLPDAAGWKKFRGVTCVAVRLFLKPEVGSNSEPTMISSIARAMRDSPVVVCGPGIGGIRELTEVGFCIYDLQRLQDEFRLSNSSESVALEIDFFRASDLAAIADDRKVAKIALKALAAALNIEPIVAESSLLDLSVVRARDAVSHFCVDSASWSPDVRLRNGIYICGDWIDRKGHASWSTEKSVVTARQAVSALAFDFNLSCDTNVIPAAPDTPQLSALRQVARSMRSLTPVAAIPKAPWVLLKQLSRGR